MTDYTCKARRAADPPEDCNWPWCGCDPHADKVLEAIEECGFVMVRRDSLAARFAKLEDAVRELNPGVNL